MSIICPDYWFDCWSDFCDGEFVEETLDFGKPSSWFCPDHAGSYPEFMLPPHRWPADHPAASWVGPLEPGTWGPREIFGDIVDDPFPPVCMEQCYIAHPTVSVPEPSTGLISAILLATMLLWLGLTRTYSGRR